MGKYHRIKIYEGLTKETLVALWREQIEARELDLALYGPLFHDVFEPDFDAWRFYEDGTESGSSPAAAENTDLTARDPSTDPKVHLRGRVQEIGAGSLSGASTDDYGLELSKNSGAYVAITASSNNVQIDTASGLTADAATTNRATNGITDGSGSFVAGEQEETNGVIEDHQLTADNFTEHVWALTLVDGDLADGDTLDFRITLNAGAPGMTNTVVPRITISKVGAPTPVSANVTAGATVTHSMKVSKSASVTAGASVVSAVKQVSQIAANVTAGASISVSKKISKSASIAAGATVAVLKKVGKSASVSAGATVVASLKQVSQIAANITAGATVVASNVFTAGSGAGARWFMRMAHRILGYKFHGRKRGPFHGEGDN